MNSLTAIDQKYASAHTLERNDFQLGETATYSRRVTTQDIESFAALTGDTNPFHLDEQYAQRGPFEGCIAHGMLVGGLISAALGTRLPGSGAIYISQQLKFTAPVRPGDVVTVEIRVIDWDPTKGRITVQTDASNQDGQTVVTGEARLVMGSYLSKR